MLAMSATPPAPRPMYTSGDFGPFTLASGPVPDFEDGRSSASSRARDLEGGGSSSAS